MSRFATVTFAAGFLAATLPVHAAPFDVGSPTTGGGAYKIETTIDMSETEGRVSWTLPKLGYTVPLADDLDLEVAAQFRSVWRATGRESGFGDVTIKAKWAFLTEDRARGLPGLAFEPKLTLPAGDDDRGLGGGDTHLKAPLIAGMWFGSFGLGAEAAYDFNFGDGDDKVTWGALALWKCSDHLTLGAELSAESLATALDRPKLKTNIGFKWKANDAVTLAGLVGRTVRTPDSGEATVAKLVVEVKWR